MCVQPHLHLLMDLLCLFSLRNSGQCYHPNEKFLVFFLLVLEIEARALHMLDKCSTTEQHPSPIEPILRLPNSCHQDGPVGKSFYWWPGDLSFSPRVKGENQLLRVDL